tara:strand:+ start:20 stop:562 length:543 start_codon:yes stop_codon:yes gene_type:complete
MPQAVTHFLIPAILIALFRDFYLRKRDRRKFPLHYVLIGGLAGLIPDFDIAVYYVLSFFGVAINQVHRTFSHNLFVPLIFLLLGFVFIGVRNKELGKHRLKLSTIFFVLTFGVLIHLILDGILAGSIIPFYPFFDYSIGLSLIDNLPSQFRTTIVPVIDAVLLIFWMIYLELRHRISDFI